MFVCKKKYIYSIIFVKAPKEQMESQWNQGMRDLREKEDSLETPV